MITIPEDICERWPDLCTPVPDDRATAPGVAAPATDPAPVPAAPAPETPSDEVAGDAATNPHALRVVRHVQRTIRLVRLTVAIQRMEGDGPSTLSIDGGALREEIGVTCPDNDCFVDFYTWCWEMGGVIAEGEGEGGYVCKFYTPAVSPALDVTLNDLPRGQAGDPDDECIMTIQVCWEIDDVLECLPAKEINICEEEEPGSPEIPAPHPNPADVAVRDTETEVHDDAGMTCQAIACGFFLNWCDDMGGISETEHVGGGYHEVTCHLPNG